MSESVPIKEGDTLVFQEISGLPEIVDEGPDVEEETESISKEVLTEIVPIVTPIKRLSDEEIATAITMQKRTEILIPSVQSKTDVSSEENFDDKLYSFRIQRKDDSEKSRPMVITGNTPMREALLAIISDIEDEPKEEFERDIVFYLDRPESKAQDIGNEFPENYIDDTLGTERERIIYYSSVSLEKLQSKPRNVESSTKVQPSLKKPPVKKALPKKKTKKPIKKPPQVVEKLNPKEQKIRSISYVNRLVQLKPIDPLWKEAFVWLGENTVINPKLYNTVKSFIDYKQNTQNTVEYARAMTLIEEAGNQYRIRERFEKKKSREKTRKEDNVFKVKYDPKTGRTEVKESKYFKALKRAAKEYITKFESQYPEYFTDENFVETESRLKQFGSEDITDLPDVRAPFKNLQKIIEEEEEEEIVTKAYILYAIFAFRNEPLTKNEFYDTVRTMFTTTPNTRKLYDKLLTDDTMFKKIGRKYSIRDETLASLSKNSEFLDFIKLIKQSVEESQPLNEQELENEEQLSLREEQENAMIQKEISALPPKYRNVVKKVSRLLEETSKGKPRYKITAVDIETGKVINIPQDIKEDQDYEYDVEIKKSTVSDADNGLFAVKDFEENEKIIPYSGMILTQQELDLKYPGNEFAKYATPITFEAGDKSFTFYVDIKDTNSIAKNINDYRKSRLGKPNAEIRFDESSIVLDRSIDPPILTDVKVWVEALEPIKKGEEIFIDYGEESISQQTPEFVLPQIQEQISIPPVTEDQVRIIVDRLIPDYAANYQSSSGENTSEYILNYYKYVRRSRVKKVLYSPVKDVIQEERNKFTIDDPNWIEKVVGSSKLRRFVDSILGVADNKDLTPTRKDIVVETSLLKKYIDVLQLGYPPEKKILTKKKNELTPEEIRELSLIRSFTPNRMDLVIAYITEVKGIPYGDGFRDELSSIVAEINKNVDNIIPPVSDPRWGL